MGVPQGSILGPVLWNILFDDVLSLFDDPEIRVNAYADDLAIVVSHNTKTGLITKANGILSKVDAWMGRNKLSLATEKTEIVVFCGMRRPKDIQFRLNNLVIDPKSEAKYLGVIIDRLLTFGAHIFYAAEKAEKTAAALCRVLPNIGGPPSSKRKVLAQAALSIALYAAPIWATALRVERYKQRITSVQRKMALRIASAYRTVSTDAVLVIAGAIPVHILADERRRIHMAEGDKTAIMRAEREVSLALWQEEFSLSTKGVWTRRLIQDVVAWQSREFGEISYHSTQVLSGHGNFRNFLSAIGKADNDNCIYCGAPDSAEHAIFICPREEELRRVCVTDIESPLRPENTIELALGSKRAWKAIFGFFEKVMVRRDKDFRSLEPNP